MPASPFRKAEFTALGMEMTLGFCAIIVTAFFILRGWDKYYAQKLLMKGERSTAKVLTIFTEKHFGPYHCYASPRLSYEFTSNSGCRATKTVPISLSELQELKEGDTLYVFYRAETPHKNYPEVILRDIVAGRIWSFWSIAFK
jgi:hypothetical protein